MTEGLLVPGQPVLIPFLMVGDPNLEISERLACALIEEGAGALELGVPFSDALADGPVIQRAAERALRHHVTLRQVLALAGRLHAKYPKIPLVVFSYLNPLMRFGLSKYAQEAREAGVAATLTVDLPPEEADEYLRSHDAAGLKTVFLASPTTSVERLPLIASSSTSFVYYVSRTGVTGVQTDLSQTLSQEIQNVRSVTNRPLAVGFGISNGKQAAAVARLADGVVVGSAFVKLVEESSNQDELEKRVRTLARELIDGIRTSRN